jgi:hypothetical protein
LQRGSLHALDYALKLVDQSASSETTLPES